MTKEQEWTELKTISEKELKERKAKEKELLDKGHAGHIMAYPFIDGDIDESVSGL